MTAPAPLSSETTAQIQSLAKQISVAHHLDSEIQAELQTHIEDKLRAYLSGELTPSESDALLLAKTHFGNPAVIKSLFQNVHSSAHTLSLARRLVAAFIVSLAVSAVFSMADQLWMALVLYPQLAAPARRHADVSYLPGVFFRLFNVVAGIAMLWAIFKFWRKRLNRGQSLWFQEWRPRMLVLITVAVILSTFGLKNFLFDAFHERLATYAIGEYFVSRSWAVITSDWTFGIIGSVANALLWLWWCDRALRTPRTFIYTAFCWVVSAEFMTFFGMFLSHIQRSIMLGSLGAGTVTRFFIETRSLILFNLAISALVGIFALLAYLLFTRARRRAIA